MASSFSVDTLELEAWIAALEHAADDISLAARGAGRRTAEKIVKTARQLAPYRTGRLREGRRTPGEKGIHVVPDTAAGRSGVAVAGVRADAPYSGFVEFGTSRMSPRPFLRPAFEQHRKAFVEELADIGVELLGGRGKGGVGRSKATLAGQRERFSLEQQLVAGSFRRLP